MFNKHLKISQHIPPWNNDDDNDDDNLDDTLTFFTSFWWWKAYSLPHVTTPPPNQSKCITWYAKRKYGKDGVEHNNIFCKDVQWLDRNFLCQKNQVTDSGCDFGWWVAEINLIKFPRQTWNRNNFLEIFFINSKEFPSGI